MPRYYCDYCDTYLTHDSPSVRKQHNAGYKHKANVRSYYQQFEEQQTQSLIDQRIKEHLGQAAAYQQVGAAYAHLLAQRAPRVPILPTPIMPGTAPLPLNPQLMSGFRPPVMPRPVPGAPGYLPNPGMPPMAPIPGALTLSIPGPPALPVQGPPTLPVPGQLNGVPGPSAAMPTTAVPGSTSAPTSSTGAPSMPPPLTSYQANLGAPASGGYDMNAPAPEADH